MKGCEILHFNLCGLCIMISLSSGFLLNNSTMSPSNSLTDQQFTYVMGEIGQDRIKMQQLENFMLQLQAEMASINRDVTHLKQSNEYTNPPSTRLAHLESVILNLKETMNQQQDKVLHIDTANALLNESNKHLQQEVSQYQLEVNQLQRNSYQYQQEVLQLQRDNAQLQQDNNQLKKNIAHLHKDNVLHQNEIYLNKNETFHLKQDLNVIQVLISQSNKSQSTGFSLLETEIHVCRNETERLIQNMDSLKKALSVNISSLSTKTDNVKIHFASLGNMSNSCCHNIQDLLQRTQVNELAINGLQNGTKQTGQEIKHMYTALQNVNRVQNSTIQHFLGRFQNLLASGEQKVILTSCYGTVMKDPDNEYLVLVKFTNVKNSHGIFDYQQADFKASGKFVCRSAGTYLFSAFVLSHGSHQQYIFYKNKADIFVLGLNVHHDDGHQFFLGTGVVAVNLNVGDELYVKANRGLHNLDADSCLTFLKI